MTLNIIKTWRLELERDLWTRVRKCQYYDNGWIQIVFAHQAHMDMRNLKQMCFMREVPEKIAGLAAIICVLRVYSLMKRAKI